MDGKTDPVACVCVCMCVYRAAKELKSLQSQNMSEYCMRYMNSCEGVPFHVSFMGHSMILQNKTKNDNKQ